MLTDSDDNETELEIESKTFNKVKKKMTILGFQEGVAKGRDDFLQDGFNKGYADGFNLGVHLGIAKAKINFKAEISNSESDKLQSNEKKLEEITKQSCRMCQSQENSLQLNSSKESFEKFVMEQQKYNDEIVKTIENTKLWDST